MGTVASVAGRLMKRLNGPRKLLSIASGVFGVGLALIAIALRTGQEWLLYISWAITGAGVGLAYSPPVATLLKWFPDRVGLASGLAITGFGLGAVIGYVKVSRPARDTSDKKTECRGPIATAMMPAVGIPATVGILGGIYFAFMLGCSQIMEFPPAKFLKSVCC